MLSYSFVQKNKKTSLQGKCTCTTIKSNNSCGQKKKGNYNKVRKEGACCFPSAPGSMTLEASFILPLFLFSMTACMLFGEMLIIKGNMHHGLMEAAKEMASQEYYYSEKERHGSILTAARLQKKYAKIEEKSGLIKVKSRSFLGSKILNDQGEVQLHMSYQICVQYPLFGTKTMKVNEKIRQKAFTGYEPSEFEQGKGYVYITKYGTVYHKNLSCSHIMLRIQDGGAVKKYLNGETKYEPCSKCAKRNVTGISQLFIAKDGECYHTSLSCSGLTRLIRKVTIWEVNGRIPCQRCGN